MKKKNQEQQKGKLKLNKERIMDLIPAQKNLIKGGELYMKRAPQTGTGNTFVPTRP